MPAFLEKNAMRVSLQSEGDEGCWFVINTSYKLRANGDQVLVGDQAVLTNEGTRLPLHVSTHQLEDHSDSFEVNVAESTRNAWKIMLFLEYHKEPATVLKGGDVVRFFHAEQEKVCQIPEIFSACNRLISDVVFVHLPLPSS